MCLDIRLRYEINHLFTRGGPLDTWIGFRLNFKSELGCPPFKRTPYFGFQIRQIKIKMDYQTSTQITEQTVWSNHANPINVWDESRANQYSLMFPNPSYYKSNKSINKNWGVTGSLKSRAHSENPMALLGIHQANTCPYPSYRSVEVLFLEHKG